MPRFRRRARLSARLGIDCAAIRFLWPLLLAKRRLHMKAVYSERPAERQALSVMILYS